MSQALGAAVRRLLRPLVRILLRHGVSFGAFSDWAKWVYVDVASDEFGIPGRKRSDSRTSILTGLSRKEVKRVRELPAPSDLESEKRYNRSARVISGWIRDPRFCDDQGEPLELGLGGREASFEQLVQDYSGDVPVRAVLDELLRVGTAERVGDDAVRLRERAYIPTATEQDKLAILGMDVSLLLSTIGHNIAPSDEVPLFQRKVAYDNLPEEALPELRRLSARHGQELLELLNRWMAEQDRDTNPEAGGTGRKHAGVGIYYFEEDWPGDEQE